MMALQHHPSDAMFRRARDHFECLYEESGERPKIMAIACHPYLSGVPHRVRHVERAFRTFLDRRGVVAWDGAKILDWYLSL
jgi:hypothetical protein